VITGGAVGCDLSVGKVPITNGYVPVWCFGPARLSLRETGNSTVAATYGTFAWKLHHPLFMPPGSVLQPIFQHRGLVTADIEARINLKAQVLPKGTRPDRVFVPYVSSYTTKPFDLASASTDESKETDIANPFDRPIYLQHLIARASVDIDETNEKSEIFDPFITARLLQARISNSAGKPIVRDLGYLNTIVAKQTRAWNLAGSKMDPGEFWDVFVNKLTPPNASAVTSGTRYVITDFGLVGWREV
jgi:hypothetical protein